MTDQDAPDSPAYDTSLYPPPAAADASGGSAPFTAAPHRRSMVLRHLITPLVALVMTPIGLFVLDKGAQEYTQRIIREFREGDLGSLLLIALGAFLLMLVAATGRVSGLAPLVAALVWGVLPFAWFVIDFRSFFDLMNELPGDDWWFGTSAPFLFPALAALLLGAAAAGRWRGRRVP